MNCAAPTKRLQTDRSRIPNGLASRPPRATNPQFAAISNRELKLLESLLSPLLSTEVPVLIANFEPSNCLPLRRRTIAPERDTSQSGHTSDLRYRDQKSL